MSDYLGALELGKIGTTSPYRLQGWAPTADGASVAVEVKVEGTSADNLATRCEALAAALGQAGNIYVHYQQGVTNPVLYRVTCSTPTFVDLTTWCAFQQIVTWTMTLAAWPQGALTTLYNAEHIHAPTSVSLAAMLGTRATTLDVTVDDDSGTDMHSVICALAPTALTDAKWLRLCNSLTWTTLTAGTDSESWGNVDGHTSSASWQTAPLDTSAYPAGKYRLKARVKQAAGTGYLMDSQNQAAVPVTRATYQLVDVGDLDLPVSDTAPGTASNLTLSIRSDGVNDITLNAILLIPLEYGCFEWHPPVATTEIDQLDVGPTGIWMDGAHDSTYLLGGPLTVGVLAAHTGTLIGTAQPTGDTWPSDWGRTSADAHVAADTNRFKVTVASHYAYYAATNAATPLVVPGAWYEIGFTHDVDAGGGAAGAAVADLLWQDIDGNVVRTDSLMTPVGAGASTAVVAYAKAPYHAARAQLRLGLNSSAADLTAYFSACSLRRCPMRLIVVAEDAGGQVDAAYVHPVLLTLKYPVRYEVAR